MKNKNDKQMVDNQNTYERVLKIGKNQESPESFEIITQNEQLVRHDENVEE